MGNGAANSTFGGTLPPTPPVLDRRWRAADRSETRAPGRIGCVPEAGRRRARGTGAWDGRTLSPRAESQAGATCTGVAAYRAATVRGFAPNASPRKRGMVRRNSSGARASAASVPAGARGPRRAHRSASGIPTARSAAARPGASCLGGGHARAVDAVDRRPRGRRAPAFGGRHDGVGHRPRRADEPSVTAAMGEAEVSPMAGGATTRTAGAGQGAGAARGLAHARREAGSPPAGSSRELKRAVEARRVAVIGPPSTDDPEPMLRRAARLCRAAGRAVPSGGRPSAPRLTGAPRWSACISAPLPSPDASGAARADRDASGGLTDRGRGFGGRRPTLDDRSRRLLGCALGGPKAVVDGSSDAGDRLRTSPAAGSKRPRRRPRPRRPTGRGRRSHPSHCARRRAGRSTRGGGIRL